MRVERKNGKLGVRVGDDGYDGIEILTTRNGYQWSGGSCNRELLVMVRDAITEFLGPAQETSARPFTPMNREQLREKIAADPDPDAEIGAGSPPIDWNEVGPVDAKECPAGNRGDEHV